MKISVKGKLSVEIDDIVVERILGLYSEEKLHERPFFKDALDGKLSEYKDFRLECDKIIVPWQLFFLEPNSLETQISHIEEQRSHKISKKFLAKRKGLGGVTSMRIVDRLIRLQNYTIQNTSYQENEFCGSLQKMDTSHAVQKMRQNFELSLREFREKSTNETALKYLINQLEKRQINVARGVLTNKILPNSKVVQNDLYKNTSGFAIKDIRIPFLFLPSETNLDEADSRQIYTLLYLLVVVGLDQYDYAIEKDFTTKIIKGAKQVRRIHSIVSEFLLPRRENTEIDVRLLNESKRNELSKRYKISPTALITILRTRKIIDAEKYEELLPEKSVINQKSKSPMRTPKISTSVRKFCGLQSYSALNSGIRNGVLPSTQAQYLIFGTINKKKYKEYLQELNI